MKNTLLRLINLIKKGEISFMIKGISKRVFSKTEAFGLKRDMHVAFDVPKAKIDLTLRSFKIEDDAHFTADLQNDGLIEKEIPACYIALDDEGKPCYRQWLMSAAQNEKLQEFWGEAFPILKQDEAIAESLFTVPKYRGNGIMPEALDTIALNAKSNDVRYVIAFVEVDNIASLKGCHRAGFSPYILRTETWRFLKRSITFVDVPNMMMDEFLNKVSN